MTLRRLKESIEELERTFPESLDNELFVYVDGEFIPFGGLTYPALKVKLSSVDIDKIFNLFLIGEYV